MIAYKCPYNKIHEDKETCFCKREIFDEIKKGRRLNKKEVKEEFLKTDEFLKKRGFFQKKDIIPKEEKQELDWAEDRLCIVHKIDKNEDIHLGPHLANVCSGECALKRNKNPERYKI